MRPPAPQGLALPPGVPPFEGYFHGFHGDFHGPGSPVYLVQKGQDGAHAVRMQCACSAATPPLRSLSRKAGAQVEARYNYDAHDCLHLTVSQDGAVLLGTIHWFVSLVLI